MALFSRIFAPLGIVPLLLLGAACAQASPPKPALGKKVVLIAGKKSHGPGEHEYEKGLRLLQQCLDAAPNLRGFRTELHLNGWPEDGRTLDDADTIVLFCDGSDHNEQAHPLLHGERLTVLGRAMKRGVGLVVLHYTVFVPSKRGGPEFLEWVGGYFDYENGDAPNRWHSRIRAASTTPAPATPNHPIARGLQPFPLREEYYYRMRFRENDRRVIPILTTTIPEESGPQTVAWAVQRKDGGRGFAFTGGHFHENWQSAPLRKMILNAIVWTAKAETPKGGVESSLPAESADDWPHVGNDKGGMRYSPLTQINRSNVKNLQVAWTYHTGDADPGANTTIECTPIVVEGVMYITTVKTKIAALDAATGREKWKYDPRANDVNRGVAYWSDGKPHGERRILAVTGDGRLISLDARTGRPDAGFGKNGVLDLRAGIERDISKMNYGSRSAPAVFEDLVYVGIVNTESQPGAPGDIRAFDVRTGKERWRFHTVPRPYEFGAETWEGDSWKERSGTNPWSGYTLDAKRGILFCGTGSASSDFYGADRRGANLFANCTLALDARTGKLLWHFQTTHHDLWDHDIPCPPLLVNVKHDGKRIDAVAQPTKTGLLFLFDRLTGKPLFGVREVPAQSSDLRGEQASPTQPEPLKPPPFAKQIFREEDVTDISSEAHDYVLQKLRGYRFGQKYIPPSVEGSVITPGFHGGATWSGASFDPTTGLLYINSNNTPYICQMRPNRSGGYDFMGYTYFNDQNGYPAIKPPWGQLIAIDLNTGEFAWQVPLGEFPELTARGVPQTGTESFGGTIVTAGGLVFIGGSKDEKFHAFDKTTGRLLWEYKLDAGGYATPCTYAVNGRQYVVIAAGGGGKLRTKSGDAFIAFALPEGTR